MFHLENASATYNGRPVLTGLTLRIGAGERVALVGKSGAGKSTLLRLLHQQRPEDTALVPQENALVRLLSVFHNIYMGRLHQHNAAYNLMNLIRPLKAEVERVRPIARRLEIEDKLFTPTGELSGGQRQRTAVGRALFHGGRVLLGDEPVSAVDKQQAETMLEAMCTTHETVVLAMHDIDLALAFTDRVIGLKDGRVVLDEPSDSLKRSDLGPVYQG